MIDEAQPFHLQERTAKYHKDGRVLRRPWSRLYRDAFGAQQSLNVGLCGAAAPVPHRRTDFLLKPGERRSARGRAGFA